MGSLLLRGAAAIMTGLPGDAARAAGPDIRIADGEVREVGALRPAPGEQVLDITGCVVYPGWVNTHHHLAQSVLKGIPAGINLPLAGWLEAVPYRYRRYFDAELLELAATIGIAELVMSGCTTIADHHYVYYPGMDYDGAQVLFDVAARFGVRFALLRGGATISRTFEQDTFPAWQRPETVDGIIADVDRLVGAYHDPAPDAMRRVVMAPTTPTWSARPDELKVFARAARSLGIRLHSHLSETADYVRFCREVHDTTPVEFVARHEWLGPDVWFAHLVHLSPPETALLGETGTGIAHCPASNCRLGSGIAPVPQLAAAGAPVSLGVDGAASNEAADMISEAHQTWFVHRTQAGAGAVTVEDVIHWGTRGGARVLGLDRVGAIAPGYAADLAVYQLDDIRYAGLHDIAVGPVASGGRPTLRHLLVAGRPIVTNGTIPGFDAESVLAKARGAVKRMTQ